MTVPIGLVVEVAVVLYAAYLTVALRRERRDRAAAEAACDRDRDRETRHHEAVVVALRRDLDRSRDACAAFLRAEVRVSPVAGLADDVAMRRHRFVCEVTDEVIRRHGRVPEEVAREAVGKTLAGWITTMLYEHPRAVMERGFAADPAGDAAAIADRETLRQQLQ